ncbi:MAG: pantetheine-phosphate adenylyltransferase [Spirochaetales bacterium]|nr:pantetheine-phosphate adenylyltransferase [Spirochaetales bacterium]MBO6048767.1 pantetheine-phosphate adenylyltransferase [Spirochaetales bacterium]MBO7349696.1 pantetheine-phosphate adenylyltransferase [Spirochaetales bacterium]
MNKDYAMFPGTFDPPSFGHMDVIERAAKLYDKFYVVVGDNISKKTMFTADERASMLKRLVKHLDNVEVCTWSGATVDFAKKNDIGVIIRGIRAINDFENEFELALVYKQMLPELEILFMPTDSRLSMMRSSMIKEMALFGADISPFVPDLVCQEVKAKLMC